MDWLLLVLSVIGDAERPGMHSHAEHENDNLMGRFLLQSP